ncbi:MAG: hypothetical protein HFF07_08050 [Oscillospiraceae bacterium]|nr:hypothetical protein [Oscillospiraceae bacterium]
MNNLKRVLSLALSGIMLVGMMAVGASAADFSDADKISNTDAVNTLVSLGVINGKDDGSFAPEEIVSRAQMAKMICVALNGGKDFKYGTKPTPTYSDIKGHWAESYIEYCSGLNIIAGQGDGTFNPDGPVTASAASKMMLVAIGYDADEEGMVGVDWEINTNRIADSNGFYKGLNSLNISEGLTRDNAAQVIFNGCGAQMVEYDYKLVTENGNLVTKGVAKEYDGGRTMLSNKFDMTTVEDVILTKVELVTSGVNKGTFNVTAGETTFHKVATDYSGLLGQTVKVLHKTGKTDEVFGVYADAKNTVVTTNQSAITKDGAKVKFDGTKYELESDCYSIVDGVVNSAVVDADALVNATSYNKVALIDNDGNNKYDVAVITTVTPAKVTYVSSDEIIAGGETYKYEDETIAEGLKKDDYVTVTYSIGTDKNVIEKIEAVEETITGTKTGEFQIDGTWYKDGTANAADSAAAGDDVTAYIVNGVIYYAEKTSSTSLTDVVFVAKVTDGTGLSTEVRFMYTDGSVVTGVVDTSNKAPEPPEAGKLYTVKKATNGYRFTEITKDIGDNKWLTINTAEYAEGGEIEDTVIADDAVVLATDKDGNKTAMYTGKQLKAMGLGTDASDDAKGITIGGAFTKKVTGLTRVGIVGIVIELADGKGMPSGSVAGENYALVLEDSYTVKDATTYKVWTGSEEVTVTDEDSTEVKKGEVIVYDAINGDKITGAGKLDDGDLKNSYVQAKSGEDIVYLGGDKDANKFEITKDTVVMYYNSADMVGMAGGEIQLADDVEGVYVENVKYIGSAGELSFLLVDVKNKLKDATEYTIADPTAIPNVSFDVVETAKAGDTVTVTASANTGYHLKKTAEETALTAKVNGGDDITVVMKDGKASFTFVMPAANVTAIAFANLEAEADA